MEEDICGAASDDEMEIENETLDDSEDSEDSCSSSIHDASTIVKKRRSKSGVGGYEETVKPTAIEEYNKYMSGVDRLDQFLSYYNFNHRTNKWWRKAFFCLLDIAIL